MVLVNYAEQKVNCKIVYYGTGESGKTTNIEYIYSQLNHSIRSDITNLKGFNERTLFFDFLSIDLGTIKGFTTTFSLYSTPGQAEYNAARKLLLNGVDGIIFVIDSNKDRKDENLESLRNLEENLTSFSLSMKTLPIVIQYNKRDLDNAMELEELERLFNPYGFPSYEAMASQGSGVFACLKSVSTMILSSLQ
ncbi:MAG: GTPase domain-containing protein [bacterium]